MNSSRIALAGSFAFAAALASSSSAFAGETAPLAPLETPRAFEPSVAAPRVETAQERKYPELYVVGPLLFGVTYGTTIGVAHAVNAPSDVSRATAYAAIPIAGPWVILGSKLPTATYWPALVASGLGQAGAVAMTIAGLAVHRDVPMPTVATDKMRVTFVPSGMGAAAVGSF